MIVESFGLSPTIVPDLSALDGSRTGFSPLAEGGVTLQDIHSLGSCGHTIVLGSSLEPAARSLEQRFGIPFTVLDSVYGLDATDRLVAALALVADAPMPKRLVRERRVLVDAMRDAHLAFAGARCAVALEPDHAAGVARLLDELAAPPVAVVIPTLSPVASSMPAGEVIVGDLESVPYDIDVLVASGRAGRTARVRGAAHVSLGFPQTDGFGGARCVHVGYRGGANLVDRLANALTAPTQKEMTT